MENKNPVKGLKNEFVFFWQGLIEVGIELATESDHQKITRSNSMAWFNAVLGLLYVPIYYVVIGSASAAAVILIVSFLSLFVVVLNAAGFCLASRYYQSLYFTLSISAISLFFGVNTGVTLLYLPALTVVFLNFDHREVRSLLTILFTTMAIAIAGDIYIEMVTPVLKFDASFMPLLRILSRLGAMFILMSELFVFARSLMRSQARLDSTNASVVMMLGTIQDAFYFVDRSWKIVHVNATTQAALERAGLPSQNLAGRHFFEMNEYMRHQHFAEELLRTMESKSSFHGEYYSHRSGIWCELRADANDLGMSIVYRDITIRKNAEARLRQDEQLQTAIFDQAATGLLLVSPDARFVRVNQEISRLLDYSEVELLQMSLWDILVEHKDVDSKTFSSLLDGSLKLYQGEHYLRQKNGTPIPFNVQVSTVRTAENVAEFMVVSLQDLSQAKASEQKLLQASKMSSLGEMAGSIAHEINNPMTIISLSA